MERSSLSALSCSVLISWIALTISLRTAQSCTIFEFADSGFAANAIHLMHAVPIFDGNNGTFFLDNSKFAYKCEEGGGWHDFFAYQDHLVPWTAAKERAGGETCMRHDFRGVDNVLHVNLKAGWEPYNAAGVSQVQPIAVCVQQGCTPTAPPPLILASRRKVP